PYLELGRKAGGAEVLDLSLDLRLQLVVVCEQRSAAEAAAAKELRRVDRDDLGVVGTGELFDERQRGIRKLRPVGRPDDRLEHLGLLSRGAPILRRVERSLARLRWKGIRTDADLGCSQLRTSPSPRRTLAAHAEPQLSGACSSSAPRRRCAP